MRVFLRAGLVAVSLIVLPAAGAGAGAAEVSQVTGRLMCVCGCSNMVVASCGCAKAAEMIRGAQSMLDSGKSGEAVITEFERRYGAWVRAVPQAEGFDRLAWILPIAVVGLGSLVVAGVLWAWRTSVQPKEPQPETLGGEIAQRYRKRLDEEIGF